MTAWGGDKSSVDIDVAIALDHLSLAAVAEGLGTCWIGAFDEAAVKDLLAVPESYRVVAMMPVGVPAEASLNYPIEPERRKDPGQVFVHERFASDGSRPMSDRNDLVIAEDITCHFPIRRGLFGRQAGVVRAVDGVSFRIPSGRTLGLVGESGCGKTTLGRTLLRLIPPTAGRFMFDGHDVFSLSAGPASAVAPQHADDLSGPGGVAESANDRGQYYRPGACGAWCCAWKAMS